MSHLSYDELDHRINALIENHVANFSQKYGYDPGENKVEPAHPGENADVLRAVFGDGGLPEGVAAFFEHYSALVLPDIWNGYFVGPPSWSVSIHDAREPRDVVDGEEICEVIAIGTDGGGSLFVALARRDSAVYRLPPGRIQDGHYLPSRGRALDEFKVAASFDQFIELLVDGLEQTVRSGVEGPFS